MLSLQTAQAATPQQDMLQGVCDRARLQRIALAPGQSLPLPSFPYPQVTRMYLLLATDGFVRSGNQALPLTEPALFVPSSSLPASLQAGDSPMAVWAVETDMNEEDQNQLGKSHMVFPRFRPLSQAWEHTMRPLSQGCGTQGFVLIENRKLGANNMGLLRSQPGAEARVAPFTLPTYDHFFFALEDCDCTLLSGPSSAPLLGNTAAFVPHGEPVSLSCGPEGRIHLVWLTLNRAYDPDFQEVHPQ